MPVNRTPPPDAAKLELCPIEGCGQVVGDVGVQCDECNRWFHYECVNVDDSIADKDWDCPTCTEKKSESEKEGSAVNPLQETLEKALDRLEFVEAEREVMRQELEELKNIILNQKLNESKEKSTKPSENVDPDTPSTSRDAAFLEKIKRFNERNHKRESEGLKTPERGNASSVTLNEVSSNEKLAVLMSRNFLGKLPEFSGDFESWAVFEASYRATTKQGCFTDEENVVRLRESLKGKALEQVKNLFTFSVEPNSIMEHLKHLYGRVDVQVNVLTNGVVNYPALSKDHESKIVDFTMKVKNYVASLKALGREVDLTSEYVLGMLSSKLIVRHQLKWSAIKLSNPNANIEEFSNFLYARMMELPPAVLSNAIVTTKPSQPNKRVMNHQQVNSNSSSKCQNCKADHPLWKCDAFKKMNVDERWAIVRDKKVCFCCLREGHLSTKCTNLKQCNKKGCTKQHNGLLHKEEKEDTLKADSKPFVPKLNTSLKHSSSDPVMFKVLPVRLHGSGDRFVDTYALLDDGSSVTLVDRDVVDKLKIGGTEEELRLQWTKGVIQSEQSLCTSLCISSQKGGKKFGMKNVYTMKNLDLPVQDVDAKALKTNFSHLRGLPLVDLVKAKPKILIGLDQAKFLLGSQIHEGKDDEPIGCKTRLGWLVYGKVKSPPFVLSINSVKPPRVQLMTHDVRGDEELHQMVKQYFTTENFGVNSSQTLVSAEEKRAINVMEKTMRKIPGEDRYEIGLLWKSDNEKLPDSLPMAMKRLVSLEKTLKKKPELMKWKNDHMDSLVKKGYARIASADELTKNWARTWYTPTFIVENPNKFPPKPRDVADVAARVDGVSLNSCLLKGPDNLAPLISSLFKFRENFVAVNADVREMFHQIRIRDEDQQCQRILWRYGDETRKPLVFIFQSMMFGPTCSPSCAQYVKNHHAQLYRDEFPEASEALIKYTYVDDYFNSHPTVEEAVKVTNEAITICKTMCFDLVGVQSNNPLILDQVPSSCVKDKIVNLDPDESQSYMTKVLGMFWKAFQDFFTYKFVAEETTKKMLETKYSPSKREVLKVLMKTFDPLGLIAHYLIRGRIVLQEIWREGVGWDDPIPEDLRQMWLEFLSELKNVENLKIPRHYAPLSPANSHVQLIIFVDASEKAFAAVAYFRFEVEGQIEVSLVMGKAKVAPIKQLSIPQLELQAAVMGVRLANTIKKHHSFEIHQTKFFSDSTCVLAWVCSRKYKFKTFVAVRVGEILESSSRKDWFHVGSNDNVADDGTKWSDPSMGESKTRWFTGPEFLKKDESEWLVKPAKTYEDEALDSIPKPFLLIQTTLKFDENFEFLEDIKPRFRTNWKSFVSVVGFILRARDVFKNDLEASSESYLTVEEFEKAECYIFRKIQQDAFPQEVFDLSDKGGKKTVDRTSKILCLNPFMSSDGVLRMSSRSINARISYAAKNPPILPNKHPLVDLMIQKIHEKNLHIGEELTIADVREKAWVINIRVAFQRVKSRCQFCKVKKSRPIMPLMGQLPEARVDFGRKPFTHVGIDCFGPMTVKYGRGTAKRYGMIFTCLTYRAVAIELIREMSTDQCMSAIRRLLTRRGQSLHFYSDNGKNFVGANNQLKKDLGEMSEALGENVARRYRIQWHFIPAYSPWMGGAWERLIQSVKRCIDFILIDTIPREDVLSDALCEAEYQMNRRPLTHIPIDHEDAKPLTPNLILFGDEDEERALAPGIFTENDAYSSKSYRRVQHLATQYTRRWLTEYLPDITRRSKWYKETKPVKVGDVVFVIEPNDLRETWKRGRVIQVYPGKDGIVRSVDVKLANGIVQTKRSVGRVAVIDVTNEINQTPTGATNTIGCNDPKDV